MLACARRRVQSVLPRPFAFSTVPKPDVPWENPMTELTNLLDNTADRISPIIPAGYGGTSPSGQSVYYTVHI
jgi:hypothetical protein